MSHTERLAQLSSQLTHLAILHRQGEKIGYRLEHLALEFQREVRKAKKNEELWPTH